MENNKFYFILVVGAVLVFMIVFAALNINKGTTKSGFAYNNRLNVEPSSSPSTDAFVKCNGEWWTVKGKSCSVECKSTGLSCSTECSTCRKTTEEDLA